MGRELSLRAEGSRLFLDVPDWTDLQTLGPRSLAAQRRALAGVTRALDKTRLSLTVNVAGQPALGFGDGVRTTLLARLVGLRSADVRFSAIIGFLRARALVVR